MYQALVAQENAPAAGAICRWVERCPGFAAQSVRSGAEVLERITTGEPVDLLITDISLPGKNGLELMIAVRDRMLPVEIIVATGVDEPAVFRKARHFGALDYLLRPFDEARLRQALALFLRKRQVVESDRPLTQEEIDSVVLPRAPALRAVTVKGIQPATLERIRAFVSRHAGEALSSEAVAQGTGLSVVSVRRYMNHMASMGEVSVGMDYHTGGRPVTLYRLG